MRIKIQAFKVTVNDPDSVLDSLTREVKEVGPDGQEVEFIHVRICVYVKSMLLAIYNWLFFR